jgi:hypothetical protein
MVWDRVGWDGMGWTSRLDDLVNRAALRREVAWVAKRDGLEWGLDKLVDRGKHVIIVRL